MSKKCPPCVTCDWWVKQDIAFHSRAGADAISGQCRKREPVSHVADGKILTRWPLTRDTEFCGRHSDLEPIGSAASVY